ncbi:hypothetical protein [Salinispora arenicola]|uniref:hypothetical protein n=1 Tax=Salinispora arenicola TaxID=168697 RepID=UPI0004766586|nr:hypothetical protein [Salinispora arenicola]
MSPARLHAWADLARRNPELLIGLVLAGREVAFESENSTRREPRVVWRPIAGHPLRKTISGACPTHSPHPAAEQVAQIAAETFNDAAPALLAISVPEVARPWSVVFTSHEASTGT